MQPPTRRPGRRPTARLCTALVVLACARVHAADAAAPSPSQHRPGGFQNNDIEFEPRGVGDLLKWKVDAWRNGLPKPAHAATPTVAPELDFIRRNAVAGASMEPSITWIGHATVLAQLGGLNVLTDPIFSDRASPLGFIGPKRHVAPGLAPAELPHVDVVLISHNHYDHLDDASVRGLSRQAGGPPIFIVPLGIKAWMTARGIADVVELDWWQTHTLPTAAGPVDFVLTPVQHWSGRSLTDRMETLWGGFAVFAPDLHLFFGGDTAYSRDFAAIRRRFADRQASGGFDIALLPIGAYEPRWFMTSQHVDPAEAVQLHLDLNAKRSIGIHWGTFELTDEALDEPPKRLASERRAKGVADEAFGVVAVGQTLRLARRAP